MQFDLFSPEKQPEIIDLSLSATQDQGYRYRTDMNTKKSDLTLACAHDYNTAGERLTAKLAGSKYLAIPTSMSSSEAANRLLQECRKRSVKTLNIAGNGIYTFAKVPLSQEEINQWLYDILKIVHSSHPLISIRSGGQSGMDTAGLVAALALNIPAIGLYPANFLRRNVDNKDYFSTPEQISDELYAQAKAIKL
jgi:hypothetical protein